MSLENAQAFLTQAEDDVVLREKLEDAAGDGPALVALGAEYGFAFTADELNDAMDNLYGDLSDDELENAAGGLGGIRQDVSDDDL
ncbi:MAG: Nif11-like leader peptide family RiPP precursor [Anaerolineae bacterium]|nr:Nif11-like leader peptide family RiPP precursor [Anaerolineae bacterium]